MTPRVCVVVSTDASHQQLTTCLEHLGALRTAPHEILVVDSSADDACRRLLAEKFPDVVYLPPPRGPGAAPVPRQVGLARASGEIICFIDDDARVDELWLDALTAPYTDPTVSGVGGRAVTGARGEHDDGLGSIGRVLPSGDLTGFFGADPGRVIDVDHLSGATMSFRASALASVGGFSRRYRSSGRVGEATDVALRLRMAGHRLVFAPQAISRHAAPLAPGEDRSDLPHLFRSRRDHMLLLTRVYGWSHPLVRRYPVTTVRDQHRHLRSAYRLLRGRPDARGTRPAVVRRMTAPFLLARSVAELAGMAAGVPAAVRARSSDLSTDSVAAEHASRTETIA